LFHQVTGCDKNIIDNTCIQSCNKTANITNLKHVSYQIEKSPGNYHRVFSDTHFLNTKIVTDLPNVFSGFLIDLRAIKTQSKISMDKAQLVNGFESLIKGEPDADAKLHQAISPTTMAQYKKGI
jgi:putative protease